MVAQAFEALSGRLSAAIAEGGVISAIEVCSVEALPLTQAVAAEHGSGIRRVSHRPRNPENRADATDREAIARFQKAIADGAPLEPESAPANGVTVIRLPIVLSNPLCLSCHGAPGEEVDPATLAAIKDRYPADEATGFSLGELRGIWRIEIPEGGGK
jgi:hypothetical protein